MAAVPPNTQKDDGGLGVAPLERRLVLLQGHDPGCMTARLEGGFQPGGGSCNTAAAAS
jgi:hypothetical protein